MSVRLQSRHAVTEPVIEADERANGAREFRYGWIAAPAAMAHLGIGSRSALYRLIAEHRLPYGRVGRRYRFRRCDLDQWTSVCGVAMSAVQKVS